MEPNTNALMSTVIDHPQRLWGGHKERESRAALGKMMMTITVTVDVQSQPCRKLSN
jgi:hypothetical protein